MLIRCNKGCRENGGTTTGCVDLDENKVVCDYCGDYIEEISEFSIKSMISQGKILRKSKGKSFQFECKSCDKTVETYIDSDGELRGKNCKKDCEFNVSQFTKNAMISVGNNNE